jgi:polar amino acid transport system substrate-binding protein
MTSLISRSSRTLVVGGIAALTAVTLLAGCAPAEPPAPEPGGSDLFDQAAADLLPEGTTEIHIASGPGYPPFLDATADGELTGAQIDEVRLIGEALGVEIVFDDIKFDAVFAALESGKTDGAAMSLGITAERLESVDFVSDYLGGTGLLVAAGNPADISLESMCGHTIAALKGSIYSDIYLPDFNAKCVADGEPAIQISTFQTSADSILALTSGRVEATMTDGGPAVYQADQSGGTIEALDVNYDPSLWGIAVPKDSELAPALQAAINSLIANGAYLDNLTKYGVEGGAIDESEIYTSADQLD